MSATTIHPGDFRDPDGNKLELHVGNWATSALPPPREHIREHERALDL